MAEHRYDVLFEAAEYNAIDTWKCRCTLSSTGFPPTHIHIQVVLKTLKANAVDTHDPVSITTLIVEPILTRLTTTQDRLPDVIRIPDTFIRSEGFAQKAPSISNRISDGSPFHLVLKSHLLTSASETSADKNPSAPKSLPHAPPSRQPVVSNPSGKLTSL